MKLSMPTIALSSAWLILLISQTTQAQVCPDPQVITCGDTLSGNSSGGLDQIDTYSCSVTAWGTEAHYLFVLTECADATITVTPQGFDATLAALPRSRGDCDPETCLAGADSGYTNDPESLGGNLAPGQYHLVVDGYYAYDSGPFTLSVECTPHLNCPDSDGDGYLAEGACPCGDDCDDADPEAHPYGQEICNDSIDQDCDDFDLSCPACTSTDSLACNTMGSENMNSQSDVVSDYCNADQNMWTGREVIFTFQGADEGITFTTTESEDIDVFVVRSAGPSNCNPAYCLGYSIEDGVGDEQVTFFAHQDETYYVIVDGWDGTSPNFDWTAACSSGSCTAAATIDCDQTISGTTVGAPNQATIYNAFSYEMPAGDAAYSFTAQADGVITAELTISGSQDLALAVAIDDGSGCQPGNMIAASDWLNANTGPTETVFFQAQAGTTYYLIVDGWTAADEAPFDLSLSCISICTGGTTECAGQCVDVQTDLDHCGACDNPCSVANGQAGCQGGACVLSGCDAGFDNCDGEIGTGCESDLTSDGTCGDCLTQCTGQDFCWQGGCTDQCPGGLTNCSAQCVDIQTDPAHCNGCDNSCDYPNASGLCTGGVCSLGPCDTGFDNCDGDPQNGCETDTTVSDTHCGGCNQPCTGITFCWQSNCTDQCPGGLTNCAGQCFDTQTDLAHCGGCDSPCAFDNASGSCTLGVCSLGPCSAGFGNCDGADPNGCEEILGSLNHCLTCGDACAFANAAASCEASGCQMGQCDSGWADCDGDPSNGCEADLNSSTTCGDCLTSCDFPHGDGSCTAGECVLDSCYNGWANCDDDPLTGCESDLSSKETCGTCAQACQSVEVCLDGECQIDCSDLDGDGYMAQSCGGDDCNDYDGQVHPGAAEICGDNIDQDCNGQDLSCGDCHDNDQDGYQDHTCGGPDCDDANGSAYPGAEEICGDGVDQDCDGRDEACTGCHDNDQDGYDDHTCGGADCNDGSNMIYPGAEETCGDGIDQDCDGQDLTCPGCPDADSDGYTDRACGGDDCNDQNAAIHPGALESCGDGIDQNCDGLERPCGGGGDSGCGCGAANGSGSGFLGLIFLLGLLEYRRRKDR